MKKFSAEKYIEEFLAAQRSRPKSERSGKSQTVPKRELTDEERRLEDFPKYSEKTQEAVFKIMTQRERDLFLAEIRKNLDDAKDMPDEYERLAVLQHRVLELIKLYPEAAHPDAYKEEQKRKKKSQKKNEKGEGQRNRSFSFGKRNTR